jgi:hypothetical protein
MDGRIGPARAPVSAQRFDNAAATLATLALRSGRYGIAWRTQRRLRLPAES